MQVNDVSTNPLTALRPGSAALTPESKDAGRSSSGGREKIQGDPGPARVALRSAGSEVTEAVRTEIARAGGEPEGTLQVKGLLEAWGRDDPEFDLNTDGTVDMADLVMLLSKLAEKAGQDPGTDEPHALGAPEDPAEAADVSGAGGVPRSTDLAGEAQVLGAPDAPPAELTVAELLEAWGKADEQYDLNTDGVVDMADLVALLSRLAEPGTPPADVGSIGDDTDDSTVATNVRDTASDIASHEPLTVRDLLQAWGREDNRYDLDQSGLVDMRDLVMLLSRLNEERRGTDADRNAVAAAPRAAGRGPDPARIDRLATALTARLRENGFTDHPPTNIHALVAQTNLAPSAQKDLLERLQEHYPAGLGVNALG